MSRAEDLVKQASAAGLSPAMGFFVTPGSEQIRATLDRDQTLSTFEEAGGIVLANACGMYLPLFRLPFLIFHTKERQLWNYLNLQSFNLQVSLLTKSPGPCIGQWSRTDGIKKGDSNAIFTSYNRNFRGRNDGNPETMNFLASPEIVTAMSYAGSTSFNPLTDTITTPSGDLFSFSPPTGAELPPTGFEVGNPAFLPTSGAPSPSTPVIVSPTSDRLALLTPFAPFPANDLTGLKVLYKVTGKCTTDTISAAGPWLKYKGHLPNISANTLIGATNKATGEVNVAYDFDGSSSGIPELAEKWKDQGLEWLVVAEHNYGEGSAREHAALQPRYLGGRIILAKSFARIHETNLKKQGVVPLTFANEADYDRIDACDDVETVGLYDVLVNGGKGEVSLRVTKRSGEVVEVKTRHSLSKDQCGFVLAGSALNLLAGMERN